MPIPVILSGGAGSRLWPVSRENRPKQCIALADENLSLLQQTVLRLPDCDVPDSPLIVCNQRHRFLIAEQMRQIDVTPRSILLEPVARDTAPAIALAALEAQALQADADPVLLVLPSDHLIADMNPFSVAIQTAQKYASQGKLVALGVPATKPHVGYGYIKRGQQLCQKVCGVYEVEKFVEKPQAEIAQRYVESGEYYWNCGIFAFRASAYLAALEEFETDIFRQCIAAHAAAETDLDFKRVPVDIFSGCMKKSVDYAVMEKTNNAVVVPLVTKWSDLGEWPALWDAGEPDEAGNIICGDVVTEAVSNCYIRSESRLVAALGLDNQVVVETSDAVLVMDKSRAQDVKTIVAKLQADSRPETIQHSRVYRPWGWYEHLASGDRFQVKHIVVKPGCALSLQRHRHRAEHWVVVRGSGKVVRGDETFLLSENQSAYIPIDTRHRLENSGHTPLELIEVQSGSYLGEDDIIRYDDAYGRIRDANEPGLVESPGDRPKAGCN